MLRTALAGAACEPMLQPGAGSTAEGEEADLEGVLVGRQHQTGELGSAQLGKRARHAAGS